MGKTGRRIWYGIAIFLSALILLISVAGIAGTWITQRAVSNSVSNLVDRLVVATQNIQVTVQDFDQKLASMQDIISSISKASTTLSQQVADQGLISSLLPEQQTTNLSNLSASVQTSVQNIRDVLSTLRSIYQTIDALPIIKLPNISQDQIDQLSQSVADIQTRVDNLKNAIAAFRSGASAQISSVSSIADQLSSRLGDVRGRLADLNTRLSNVQTNLAQLKQTLTRLLVVASILGSLFLLFVAYTQVEFIRLFVQRWRSVGESAGTQLPAQTPVESSHPPTGESSSDTTADQEKS